MLSVFKQHKEDFKIIFAGFDLEKCFRSKDKHFLTCRYLVTHARFFVIPSSFRLFPRFLLCGINHLLLLVSRFMINSVATVFMVYLAMGSVLVIFDHIVNFTCRMNVNKFIFLMTRMFEQRAYCLSMIWMLFEKIVI